jgi:hypothetical protein
MTNRRQRHSHKKKMTKKEWKLFRDIALEARDAQLDLLVPDAEVILRDARAALLDEFRVTTEVETGDDEVSESTNGSVSIQSQIRMDEDILGSEMSLDDGEAASLPAFDPHMYASTVRRKTSRKRSEQTRTTGNTSRRKRRKQQDFRQGGTSFRRRDAGMAGLTSRGRPRQHKHRRGRKSHAPISYDGDSPISGRHHSSEGESTNFESVGDELVASRPRRRGERSKPCTDLYQSDSPASFGNERSTNRVNM